MSNSSDKGKSAGQDDYGLLDPESFKSGAREALHAYLAGPRQRQARWQEKLRAPFERLSGKQKPTDAEIREVQEAHRTALAQVSKEIAAAGKEMGPPRLFHSPAGADELDIPFDSPLTLADIRNGSSGAIDSKIRTWEFMARHVFEPTDYHPDGRNSFGLVDWGREPANTTFFGGVDAQRAMANGRMSLHNVVRTDPSPRAPQVNMAIWAGVGALLIPQIEKGWLWVKTWVSYWGAGIIDLPPWQSLPLNPRADNFFKVRMVMMSTPVTTSQWRTELDRTFPILSEGSTGATATIGGNGLFGTLGDQALLVPFDNAGGPPRLYAMWTLCEDDAVCGPREEVVNSVDIDMNCMVPFIKVDELVKHNIVFR